MPQVLIAGISTRAAAESAARAGFAVTAVDAFADVDQHPSVRALLLPRPFTAAAAAAAARTIECDAVTYLSNFENHPEDVAALAAGRELWGNSAAVLSRVRDPVCLERALRGRGLDVAQVRRGKADATGDLDRDWLVKPLASGGGHAVRKWNGEAAPADCYLQEVIPGTPGSVAFVAAGGRAVVLGVTWQLVGDPAFGATGYRYCGNILVPAGAEVMRADTAALARAVAEDFQLLGVNGIDFINHQGRPCAIEVNPRWTASMELVERASGVNVFGAHAAACANGTLPALEIRPSGRAVGKAVVFARQDVSIVDTSAWLEDEDIRDVPRAGERIRAGRPVCTVFATGTDAASCYAALARRAAGVYADLAG